MFKLLQEVDFLNQNPGNQRHLRSPPLPANPEESYHCTFMSFIKPTIPAKIFFSSLVLGTGGLGVWQTDRYYSKITAIEHRRREIVSGKIRVYDWDKADTPSSSQSPSPSSSIPERFHVTGMFDYDNTIYVGLRTPPPGAQPKNTQAQGLATNPQGYWVVTPFLRTSSVSSSSSSTSAKPWWKFWATSTTSISTSPPLLSDSNANSNVLLVNRGWVFKSMVDSDISHPTMRFDKSPQQAITQIKAIESSFDRKTRFSPPQDHNPETNTERKLLWLQREAATSLCGLQPDATLLTQVDGNVKDMNFPIRPNEKEVSE